MWVVFRRDTRSEVTETVGEFWAESSADAIDQAQRMNGFRDWWDYWTVPCDWFKEECLDKLLAEALH
jgi:hypothetical protein